MKPLELLHKGQVKYVVPEISLYRMAKLVDLFGFSSKERIGVNANHKSMIQWYEKYEKFTKIK